MTEPTAAAKPLSLISRIIGVITSPRPTFEQALAVPRPVGVLFVAALLMGVAAAIPQFTPAAQEAVLNAQIDALSRNGPPPADAVARLQTLAPFLPYVVLVSTLIFVPIVAMVLGAVYWAIFNTIMGGTATFKQVLTVVTHSQIIRALSIVAAVPFMLSHPTMKFGGPFNLSALAPMVDETSRLARFLGNISVFDLWAAFVTATGLSVLYRRSLGSILVVVLGLLVIVAYGFTFLSR
ncbi:MAG TPA: YIP1 family protein [Vicinamibacterales bacterium]|nr:YIP1 family protein [Vicinamibacterales bacterium]